MCSCVAADRLFYLCEFLIRFCGVFLALSIFAHPYWLFSQQQLIRDTILTYMLTGHIYMTGYGTHTAQATA